MNSERKTIIMSLGPPHLFWATGIFYLWELADIFNMVLVADGVYAKNPRFLKIVDILKIKNILFIPHTRIIAKHHFYNSALREFVETHKPVACFQYNKSYIDNMYIFFWCLKYNRNCRKLVYQLGRMAYDWNADFAARHAADLDRITVSHRKVPLLVARTLLQLERKIRFFLNYKLLPLVFVRKVFKPRVNVYTGTIYDKNQINYIDAFFVYGEGEMHELKKVHGKSEKFICIIHPAATASESCLHFLYGKIIEKNTIIILPSYGYTSKLIQAAHRKDDIVLNIAEIWIRSIGCLLHHFPGYEVKFKCHPLSLNDPFWDRVLKNILDNVEISIIPPHESAEKYIMQSKVIVGDMSTALSWASRIKSKTVISLDIFGYGNADEGKHYEGIHYFDSLDKLIRHNFNVSQIKDSAIGPHKIFLSKFINELTSGLV